MRQCNWVAGREFLPDGGAQVAQALRQNEKRERQRAAEALDEKREVDAARKSLVAEEQKNEKL